MSTLEVGDLLYEYSLKFTKVTEYGFSMGDLLAGKAPPPPGGARFDVAFEGSASGPKLKGSVVGVDYLEVRADGRFQLRVHAEITTEDGKKIALFADGVALPREGSMVADLRENATLSTAEQDYLWVNPLQIWCTGTVDLAEQTVHIKGYAA